MAAALLLALPFSGPAVNAQDGKSGAATTTGRMLQAPTGHRQPRAGDVPNENNLTNPNDPMNKQDAAFDKKIKSICRGCQPPDTRQWVVTLKALKENSPAGQPGLSWAEVLAIKKPHYTELPPDRLKDLWRQGLQERLFACCRRLSFDLPACVMLGGSDAGKLLQAFLDFHRSERGAECATHGTRKQILSIRNLRRLTLVALRPVSDGFEFQQNLRQAA